MICCLAAISSGQFMSPKDLMVVDEVMAPEGEFLAFATESLYFTVLHLPVSVEFY